MLYHLLYPLAAEHGAFNVVRYITFRTAAAALTALFISFLLGPPLIRALERRRVGQPIRKIGPDHQKKAGTPTMGGILILLALGISVLLWWATAWSGSSTITARCASATTAASRGA